jgi:thioredoxin 1
MDMPIINVTDDSFEKEVLQAVLPVVVEFSKPGLNSFGEPDNSTRTQLILSELAPDYDGRAKFVRLVLDDCPKAAAQCGVTAAPALLFVLRSPDFHLKSWVRKKIDAMLD